MSSIHEESQRRVLIASANPLFAKGLQKMIGQRWQGRPVEIRLASSMEDAITALDAWQPDLVIVDYDDVDRPGHIQREAFLSRFITGDRSMQVMLVSLGESGEVVVYDRRTLTPAQAEDWLDIPWGRAQAPARAEETPRAGEQSAPPQFTDEALPNLQPVAEPAAPEPPLPPSPGFFPQIRSRSGGMKHIIIVGAISLVLSLILGFGLAAADLTPAPSATQAAPIDAMIHLQTWLIAFLFSLITVFIVYSAVVFRKGKVAGGGEQGYGAPFKSSTRLEVIWTLIPLGLVLALSFIGAQDLAAVRQVDPQAMEVRVTGFQWGWLFDYPETGIQSNTLYLPVDKQVHLVMTSRDVIHSFWVPEFRVKQDLLPGENMIKELRVTPTEIGEYKVRCAEMCGGAHALMESPVVVVSQADFDAWVAEQTNAAAQPPEERGRRLAETQGCVTCHSLDGSRVVGPTWQGLYNAQVPLTDGSTVTADDAYLYDAIVDPNKQVHQGFPPGVMQSYKHTLSDEQIRDIIEFIKTVQ